MAVKQAIYMTEKEVKTDVHVIYSVFQLKKYDNEVNAAILFYFPDVDGLVFMGSMDTDPVIYNKYVTKKVLNVFLLIADKTRAVDNIGLFKSSTLIADFKAFIKDKIMCDIPSSYYFSEPVSIMEGSDLSKLRPTELIDSLKKSLLSF